MVDASIGAVSSVQNTAVSNNQIDPAIKLTGAGALGANGVAPDPTSQGYQAIAQSLSQFFPQLTGDQIDILIAEATMQLKEIIGETDTNELRAKEEQKSAALKEKIDQFKEAEAKLAEAKEAAAKNEGMNETMFVLQAIGTALAIVTAAIMIATGVGAVVGALLLASVVVSTIMTIDAGMRTFSENGLGMAGQAEMNEMMKNGASEEEALEAAKKADETFATVMTAISIALSVLTIAAAVGPAIKTALVNAIKGASSGTASAAGGAASSTSSAAGSAANKAAEASKFATKARDAAEVAKHATGAASAGTQAAAAGVSIEAAKNSYDAAVNSAEAQRMQADAQEMQAFIEQLNDFIDQILTRINGSNQRFNTMLDDIVQSITDRGQTMARAQFSG